MYVDGTLLLTIMFSIGDDNNDNNTTIIIAVVVVACFIVVVVIIVVTAMFCVRKNKKMTRYTTRHDSSNEYSEQPSSARLFMNTYNCQIFLIILSYNITFSTFSLGIMHMMIIWV